MDTALTANGLNKTGAAKASRGRPRKRHVPGTEEDASPTEMERGKSEFEILQEQAAKRFEQLFQGLPLSCYCYDTDGRIMEWNRISEALFRLPAAQALFQPVWEVVGRSEDVEILRAFVRSVIAGQSYEGVEWEDAAPNGLSPVSAVQCFPDARPGRRDHRRHHGQRGH